MSFSLSFSIEIVTISADNVMICQNCQCNELKKNKYYSVFENTNVITGWCYDYLLSGRGIKLRLLLLNNFIFIHSTDAIY